MQPDGSRELSLEEKKPFLEHLEDLRQTIIKILMVSGIAAVACFFFVPAILHWLKTPLVRVLTQMDQSHMIKEVLRSLAPTGAFVLGIKISFISGLVFASPLCLYFLARFLLPAMTRLERKVAAQIFTAGAGCFIAGLSLCYWVALPQSLKLLWRYNEILGIVPLWTIESYVSFALFFLLAFGICFETPMVILILVRLQILSTASLRTKRRYAVVAILVVAAVLTPPDVVSQIMLAAPMLLLYEACILIGRWMESRKNKP